MKAYVKSRRPKPKPEEFQETIESNTFVNHVPRSGNWFSALDYKIDETGVDGFIEQMQDFVSREGAFEVIPFLREKKISWASWHNIREQFPRIKQAYTEMKIHLGYNQRHAVRLGEIEKTFSVMSMHTYDPEYDAINKYHSALRKDEAISREMPKFIVGYDRSRSTDDEGRRKEIENEQDKTQEGITGDKAIEAVVEGRTD